MNGQDLINDIQRKSIDLDKALGQLGRLGREFARAERDYRVALRKAILIERNKGTPVTIISDICRGEEEIADMRMKKEIALALYKACTEGINVLKLELKLLDEQIGREWGRRT